MMADLRIGVVGTGAIGRTHIERINTRLQGAKVIGCADAKSTSASRSQRSTTSEHTTPAKR